MTDLPDAELLRLYADRHSEEAFAELVRRHLPLVFNTALRRVAGNPHCAEEITQIVFSDLAQKSGRLSRHPALPGWLHTSTRYAAAELVRREQRRLSREQQSAAMPNDHAPQVDWETIRPAIDDALDQLDKRDRTAVLLRFFENQQLSQIGKALALSEDAARKRIDRALEKLRRVLAKRGIASTTAALGLALANNIATAAPTTLAASITSAAVSTSTAASTTGLISFFAMTKLQTSTLAVLVVALAATAGSVSFGVVVSRQQAELSTITNSNAVQSNSDQRQLAELREKLGNAEKARDAIRAELRKLADKRAKREREEQAALYGPARRFYWRLYFQRQYRPLFDKLNLDAATREKFIAIEIDDSVAELAATLHERKTTGEDDAPMEKLMERWKNTDERIKELLGPAGHAAYREYLACTVSFKEIGYALADANCALTDEEHAWLGHEWYTIVVLPTENTSIKDLPETDSLLPSEQAFLDRAASRFNAQQVAGIKKYMEDEHTYIKTLRALRK